MTPAEFAAVIENKGDERATEEKLLAFEEKLRTKLPEDYRSFLGMSGGGLIFEPPVSYLDAKERDLLLRHMNSLREVEAEFAKPSAYPLPAGLLCIGNDSGGNSIMLSLTKERFGQIFMLDHEMVAYEGEPEPLEEAEEYGLIKQYSASFTQFVADLSVEDD
ncbi:SMI1/KNR4 family protein [Agrobacterium sp. rho-8.1]|nr:SMI1/KNR4 family protein [Agrobacterium sp. rho-8.1]